MVGTRLCLKKVTQSKLMKNEEVGVRDKEAIVLGANRHPQVVQLLCYWEKITNFDIS
jgi:hypothetical protein